MAGRAGFAIAVLFLVVDRLADRAGSPPPEPMETRAASSSQDSAMSQKALARQEEVLVRVMQGQEAATRTMQAEQQVLARAHQAIEGLAQGQYQLTDRVGRMLIQMAKLDEDARAGMEVRTKTDRGIKQATVTLAQALPMAAEICLHLHPSPSGCRSMTIPRRKAFRILYNRYTVERVK
jgi:hypothetical protein